MVGLVQLVSLEYRIYTIKKYLNIRGDGFIVMISNKNATANIGVRVYMGDIDMIVFMSFFLFIPGIPLLYLFCICCVNPIISCCMCSKRYIKNTFFGTGFGDTIVSTNDTDDDTIASVDSETVV